MMMAKQCGWPPAKVILPAERITLSSGSAPEMRPRAGFCHSSEHVNEARMALLHGSLPFARLEAAAAYLLEALGDADQMAWPRECEKS